MIGISSTALKDVAMERNMAYELHKPLPQRKGFTRPMDPSTTPNPIYEDMK